jgi:Skp family chaperone for outer membrane proteins
MRKNTAGLAAGIFIGIFCWLACGISFADESRFAFVDIAKIVDEYQKTKDNDAVLQALGKQKEDEREAIVQEVKQLRDELALLSEDAKAKQQEAIEEKVRGLQEFDQTVQRDLNQQRNRILKEIFEDIDETISAYGQSKELDFIFNERVLVFRAAKYDVTMDILTELNANYATGDARAGR